MNEEKKRYRTHTIGVDHSVVLSEVAISMTKKNSHFTISKQEILHFLIDLVASDKELYNQAYEHVTKSKLK